MFHVKHRREKSRYVRATRMEYLSPFNAERVLQAGAMRCTEHVSTKKKNIFLTPTLPLTQNKPNFFRFHVKHGELRS